MILKSTLRGFISGKLQVEIYKGIYKWKAAKDKNVISELSSEWRTSRKNASRDCPFKKIKKPRTSLSMVMVTSILFGRNAKSIKANEMGRLDGENLMRDCNAKDSIFAGSAG